ncbi:hypothetical protein [Nocardioides xinjiangensis]|uniref:hypothetical protein n=1 Tax=Nocardioides xinjiangensis TaxID=2817376 RepID=UPI001B301DA4|nr:hypothetical protein [Nocardioides sp. SYSU D00514]
MVAPMRWFARTYGLAVVAHLVGNPAGSRTDELGSSVPLLVISAALGVLGLLLLVLPDVRVLAAAAALTLASVWLELPVTGNHWLLVGFIAAAVLVSLLRPDPWAWLSVTGRWLLLGFYSFAAFAKLNTGFLDPSVSCGVFYANQSLSSFGLPTFDSHGPLRAVAIIGPVLTELSVPVLLAFSRTRRAGVLLALIFHTIISLDVGQHFYDFTAALVALLCLFLPESTNAGFEARAARPSGLRTLGVVLAGACVTASLLPPVPPAVAVVKLVGFAVWVPVAVWLILRTAHDGLGPAPQPMRLPGVAASALVTVVIVNGLTPYLEVKTSVAFNMYANLVTVAGETNHLVIRRTAHLRSVQDDLLEVVETTDDGLDRYRTDGYLLPRRNLLDYLARHPEVTVVVRGKDGEETLDGSHGARLPLVVRNVASFRSVDQQDPPRCQSVYLPAL